MVRFAIILSLVSVLHAFDYTRRCLLLGGKCVSHCPRNMYPYHTRCDGQTMSQRTCETPVVYVIGYTCGWSRCDCIGDLLLDEETGLCVEDKDCQMYPSKVPKLKSATERRKIGRPKSRSSKRIKIKEDELTELI
ncbi:uncharacterized protein LOC124536518 [Vanessa cardui]|uniref:uncharacterized protein LOC124536518 n=1 Tax=Vanessa cardui TaxID=171605 RepID=UPI001F12AAEA|nr:uncharacterized protein LOC124536518 [Vanessa cardui]